MYKIGKLKLENPFILAPMLGVNCLAFRLLCKEQGCALTSTPMIHINWLLKNKAMPESIEFSKKEKPIAVQLIGNDPSTVKQAVEIVEPYADVIDFNFGCPEGDVLGMKMGAYMMKHPDKIPKLIEAAVSATNKPVTAKIRSGWDEKSVNALEIGKLIEDAGANAITIHARTRKQVYAGKADWNIIKKLKNKLNIPVIGNGDAWNAKLANEMMKNTGCDMVMIGRAAIGYPFIFKQCVEYQKNQQNSRPTLQEREDIINKLFDYYNNIQKHKKFSELKQHVMWMFTMLTGAKNLRQQIMKSEDEKQLRDIVDNYFFMYEKKKKAAPKPVPKTKEQE